MTLLHLTDEDVRDVPLRSFVDGLESALRRPGIGSDDPPRAIHAVSHGQLLVMPASGAERAGVKIVSVAPGNTELGHPRIQGLYVLFDAKTLTPIALIDAAELTAIRTVALSAVAARHLASPGPRAVAIVGSGVQAWSHLRVLYAEAPRDNFLVIGRDKLNVSRLVQMAAEHGIDAEAAPREELAHADVVVCCTSARRPVVSRSDVAGDVLVIAVGSHEPDAAEMAPDLLGDSIVVVETRDVAMREAGDVIQAIDQGVLAANQLIELGKLVRGEVRIDMSRPRIFKSVGMAWEDLVAASVALDHSQVRP